MTELAPHTLATRSRRCRGGLRNLRRARAGRVPAPALAPVLALALAVALGLPTGCGGAGLGAETRADITARMATVQKPVEACYQAALHNNRKLTGMMVLAFVAAPSTGEFRDITVTHDEVNDPAVRKCVIDEVGKLKLEKPQSTRLSISYPIHFAPTK
jgi:hypothetical protein